MNVSVSRRSVEQLQKYPNQLAMNAGDGTNGVEEEEREISSYFEASLDVLVMS